MWWLDIKLSATKLFYQQALSEDETRDALTETDLTVLDDVGARRIVHVAARVVSGIPLAAPRTGHAWHASEMHINEFRPMQAQGWENTFRTLLGRHARTQKQMRTHRHKLKRCKLIKERPA